MRARFSLLSGLLLGMGITVAWADTPATPAPQAAPACPALLQHTFPRLQDGKPQSLCQYSGKVVLVVNTASYCGFTSQYKDLEAAYKQLKASGLVVLGFPSNDFFQEKSDDKAIADFCYNTYGVAFPMFSKSAVRGSDVNPFYRALAKATGKAPSWNFNKYLIDRKGQVVTHYGSSVTPSDKDFKAKLDQLLAQQP